MTDWGPKEQYHVYFKGGQERVTVYAASKREARLWAESEHPGKPIFSIHKA